MRSAAFVAGCTFVFSSAVWAGGSIFDDDYTPPKPVESPPVVTLPSAMPQTRPAPVPEKPTPSATTAPAGDPAITAGAGHTQVAHRAMPDRESRTKCRMLFEEIYAAELKDRTPAGRRKLAQTLLVEAAKVQAGSPDHFVLLNGAQQAAEEGQNLAICFDAAHQLASTFDVDELAMKAGITTKLFPASPASAMGTSENIDALREFVDQVIANDDASIAAAVETASQRAVACVSDVALKAELKNETHRVTAYREARAKVAPLMETLKKTPEDPAANQAVGAFFCFQCGQWKNGLQMLAKGNDAQLKEIAMADLSAPANPDARLKLADRWSTIAGKLQANDRPSAMQHAADLYSDAEVGATGLQKLLIEKKLAQIPLPAGPHRVNLLALFDPATGAVSGNWQIKDGALLCDATKNARAEFLYEPPAEYDYTMAFTLVERREAVVQSCYAGGHPFTFLCGGFGNTISAFEHVANRVAKDNKTTTHRDQWLVEGRHYVFVMKVRKTGVDAYIDGQLAVALKTDFSDVSISKFWKLTHNNALGVGGDRDVMRFDAVEVKEISGKGKRLTQ